MHDALELERPKHTPVLFNETIELLKLAPGAFVIDGTLNGGGHAREVVKRIGPAGKFLGIDLDPDLLRDTAAQLKKEFASHKGGLRFRHANFANTASALEEEKLGLADALLLDLGFSSAHLAGSGKGFAFQKSRIEDEPLQMTYDPDAIPVKQLLRELTEQELADAIYNLAGERYSRRIARSIKEHLRRAPIETTNELAEIVRGALPKSYERGRIDPATRTFQALRMLANHELENLEAVLAQLPRILKPGGRAVIISFHSLEDGMVKRVFRQMQKDGQGTIITKKPITATRQEQHDNPRSRSAKLRALEIA